MKSVPKILVCDPLPGKLIEFLKGKGFEVDIVQSPPPDILRQIITDYDAMIVRSATKVTAEVIKAGKRLRLIARAGAGVDNIDVRAALERGVRVVNTPEAVSNAVAELTICLAFSLIRSVPSAVESLKSGKWEKKLFVGRELSGLTVGVVGLGNIGTLVATKMKALGAKVIAYRRNVDELRKDAERLGIEAAKSLEDLLRRSELVTLHVPYDSGTHHLISESSIRLMPRASYLINTSRAWVVDGKALLAALNDGVLEGAAIDVHYNEPPREDWEWELIKHPRVIATPHIGAQTREASERIAIQLAEKIIAEFAET